MTSQQSEQQPQRSKLSSPIRIYDVPGFQDRYNNIIFMPRLYKSCAENSMVVFFGGDVQTYRETMETHEENVNYRRWNLDDVSILLHAQFPESHIVVVLPHRLEFKTFSCYDNFVFSNTYGIPNHEPSYDALNHLNYLLHSIIRFVNSHPKRCLNGKQELEKLTYEGLRLKLVGFSKGCVVLNQFIYEFHFYQTLEPENKEMAGFVSKITHMYFLDGGHHGKKNTWVTSHCLLDSLTRLGIAIHVHVSPYQVRDSVRPWIGQQEKIFCDWLKKLGAPYSRTLHFGNQQPTLNTHFEVLAVFKSPVI